MVIKRKGQILSLDLMSSIIIFILLILLFVGFFVASRTFEGQKKYDYELDYMFRNFEVNMNDPVVTNDFLNRSRVDVAILSAFALENKDKSIDEYIIGNLSLTKGIGLYATAYDLCLYFTDDNLNIYELATDPSDSSKIHYLGTLRVLNGDNYEPISCERAIAIEKRNPCEGYSEATSMLKVVLLDFGDPLKNRIVQMNVVVCKI